MLDERLQHLPRPTHCCYQRISLTTSLSGRLVCLHDRTYWNVDLRFYSKHSSLQTFLIIRNESLILSQNYPSGNLHMCLPDLSTGVKETGFRHFLCGDSMTPCLGHQLAPHARPPATSSQTCWYSTWAGHLSALDLGAG